MSSIVKAGPFQDYPNRVVLFSEKVKAGFPSPAESYAERTLNLHELAVVNPAATYFLEVAGLSMVNAGIFPKDYLVVDRALVPGAGDIVVAEIGGEFTVKYLEYEGGRPILVPGNSDFPVIRPEPGQDLTVWGVVRGVFRRLK